MTEISVIIACLNGAATLAETLDSLAAQRWDRPWEIVFADNGSTDASRAIFAERAARHPEVAMRLVDASARRGKAHALNLAIRAAAGRSLLFCDADDTVAPGWLAAMGRALETHDLVAARFDLTALNPDWTLAERPHVRPTGWRCCRSSPSARSPAAPPLGFHRRVFEAVGGFDPAFAAQEDTDFCIRAHRKGFEIRMVPDAVYNYRFRDTPEAIYRQAYAYSPRRGAAAPAPHGRAPLPRAAAVAEPRVAQRPAVGGMAEGEGAAAAAEPARAGAVQPPARHGDGEPRRVARLPRRAAHPRRRAGRAAAAPAPAAAPALRLDLRGRAPTSG